MIKCYKCGAEHTDDAKFCNKCGVSFEPELKYYCPYCDNEISNKDAKFCNKCGKAFDDQNMLIADYDDHAKYVCSQCGVLLKSKRIKFCKNCGTAFNDENKPLKWDDNHPLYRLCTHCGQEHKLTGYPIKCGRCGHDLDLKPRTEPKLTKKEQEVVDKIAAEEKQRKIEEAKKEAEEKARLEAEAKEAEEKRRLEREERQKKIKKIIKIFVIVMASLALLFAAGVFIWHSFDDKNIAKAEASMAEGDYNSAIKYYSYIMPLSKAKNECDSKIEKINKAAQKYEEAEDAYEKNEYLKAAQLSKEAIREYQDFKVADDLFDKSMENLGEYLKKLYDEKKYQEVYDTVNVIYEPYRTELINTVYNSLVNMINENCNTAQKYYDAGNMDEAIKYATAARAIVPNDKWAESIISQANLYKNYITNLNNASAAYNRGEWSTAKDYYEMVPNNEIGKKALANYPTFVRKIEEDIQYILNPVDISNKYALGHYSTWHDNDRVDMSYTLTNKTNRGVNVRILLDYNDRKTEYTNYYLSPKETVNLSYTMYDVYVYPNSDWTYRIVINNTDYE